MKKRIWVLLCVLMLTVSAAAMAEGLLPVDSPSAGLSPIDLPSAGPGLSPIYLSSVDPPSAGPGPLRSGVRLGMSREEVIACEGEPPKEVREGNLYYFGKKAAGDDADIIYTFGEADTLVRIHIRFTASRLNPNRYVDDFERIDSAYIAKYGEPAIDSRYTWSGPEKDDIGAALMNEALMIRSQWQLAEGSIVHLLAGVDGDILHAIQYRSADAESGPNTEGI